MPETIATAKGFGNVLTTLLDNQHDNHVTFQYLAVVWPFEIEVWVAVVFTGPIFTLAYWLFARFAHISDPFISIGTAFAHTYQTILKQSMLR